MSLVVRREEARGLHREVVVALAALTVALCCVSSTSAQSAPATVEVTGVVIRNDAPEIQFRGQNGAWVLGFDSANAVPNRDFVLGRIGSDGCELCVEDFLYAMNRRPFAGQPGCASGATVLGIGVAPPPDGCNGPPFRITVGGGLESDPRMGVLALRAPYEFQRADILRIIGGNGQDRWHIDSRLWMSPTKIRTAKNGEPVLTLRTPAGTYGYVANGDVLEFRQVDDVQPIFSSGAAEPSTDPDATPLLRFVDGGVEVADPRIRMLEDEIGDLRLIAAFAGVLAVVALLLAAYAARSMRPRAEP